jgi:nitroimidazol reductase NimA-like FMN-containing flavoprotein (pyridoxamine 5'-phosphate oxidase superfamily)
MHLTKQSVFLITLCAFFAICTSAVADDTHKQKENAQAQEISASAEAGSNHPEVEEGVSCNDCHTIKLDADTTATQMWLNGETMNRQPGEGVMPEDTLWKEIVKLIGGIKKESKTYVLGTCLNNVPLTTTAEFTLDPEKKVLYGFHEVGTEKLKHIKNNPKVSLNWHEEFESFADFRCAQIRGRAELIDEKDKRYDDILIKFLPYEDGARLPADATPEQREKRLKNFRDSIRERMVISKITIDMVTVANIEFARQGIRRYQRWTRD